MTDLAPLTGIPEAPAPANGQAEWFSGAGGARLRAALFRPRGQARGSVVVSGGRTEPLEKYFELVGELQDRGFVVLVHDWRGQGLSVREVGDRLKGHANGYRLFLDDFQALLKAFEGRLPKPWVAFGHSMGGALVLLALAHGETRFSGAILTAPMLKIRTSPLSQGAARWATRINMLFGRGKRPMRRPGLRAADDSFEGNVLTHDRRRFARHQAVLAANPDLALGAPTWGWLDFALRSGAYLARPERLRAITIPVTIVSAEEERLVDNAAQAIAARLLPQGRLVVVPGAYHEILMETDPMRNFFTKALDALLGRAAPEPAKPPRPAAPAPVAATPASVALEPAPAAAVPASVSPAAQPASTPVAAKPASKASTSAKPKSKPKVTAEKPVAKPKAAGRPKTAAVAPAANSAVTAKPVAKKGSAKPKAAARPVAVKAAAKAAAPPKLKAGAKPTPAKKATVVKSPVVSKAASKPAAAKPLVAKTPAVKTPTKAAAPKKAPGRKPAKPRV